MCSSSLSWPKPFLFGVILFWGCSNASKEWPRSLAVDNGGFSVRMPQESGAQNGTLYLGVDTIDSHINILADSGITYAASWFELPRRYAGLEASAALDSVWPLIVKRVNGTRLANAPDPWSADASVRAGWFDNSDDIRLGVVLHTMGSRMVVMNAATPAPFYKAREERNMMRFLTSFEKE